MYQAKPSQARTRAACLLSSIRAASAPHASSGSPERASLRWQRRSSARPMCAHRALPRQASLELCHLGAATAAEVTRSVRQLQCALTRSASMSTTSLICSCTRDWKQECSPCNMRCVAHGRVGQRGATSDANPASICCNERTVHMLAHLICSAAHLQPDVSPCFVHKHATYCTSNALAAACPCNGAHTALARRRAALDEG